MLWSVPKENYLAPNVKCVKASPDLEENLVPELALHTYNPNTREAKEGGSKFEATLSYMMIPCLKRIKIKNNENKTK